MKRILFGLALGSLSLASCSSDDDNINPTPELNVPSTYTFERNSNSTVSYSGQTLRLRMTSELLSSFNDFDNQTQESLSNMFSNENNPFSEADLNETSKSVKSKVAASQLYFSTNTVESNELKADFESYIDQQMGEVKANRNELAAAGQAGQIADGSKTRYVNAKGLELDQAFAKGLIGALLADQMLNNYLSSAVLDEGDNVENNNNNVTEEGASYTTMEHKWDEAYGYLYGDPSIPAEDPNSVLNESDDHLLFNYLGEVDADSDFAGIAEETFEAFKKGRAAIEAGDYELRDEQANIIRENISKVIAVRAVHYLAEGAASLEEGNNMGSTFHELSEGYGFVYSLRFTHNPETGAPYLSAETVKSFREQMMNENGFWSVSPETLEGIAQEIAAEFGFSVEMAAE
ncbi:DUF4856 domain-containing protein [Salegentibacter chungangensis]|uniref:DUF4856 domain-containing protein n=1 Tax=Salegentibacter chungangensis TaxID=1335724 RepID=A0ABW3NUX6_9FLAO